MNDIDWRTLSLPGIDGSTVAIVLGGGGAIGGETVRALAAMGAKVALVTRDLERSTELAKKVDAEHPVLPGVADLAKPGDLERMVAQVSDGLGTPTVLVNSAAIGAPHNDITAVSRDEVSKLFDVNVVAAYEAAKAVAPGMRTAGYGRIVNVASIAALRVTRGGVAYGVSKAAVISLTEQLAADLAGGGITVNCVSPGQTPTKLRDVNEAAGSPQEQVNGPTNAIPLGRRGRLQDYVGAILFLSSSLAGYITGVDIPVEGGIRLVRPKSF
ncbi:beta-ketoacyl-ACP reductase [Rugosimonospora africana]|uniref:Beta-ketoacyl-ACP reductase n=2 Tax=Rugosimonospora africana TaxID=556532 RepID=A0A8J3VTK5_9ACTN|nr:beta-ketoacyl-ACP reductase [Rugosimonospora africana]